MGNSQTKTKTKSSPCQRFCQWLRSCSQRCCGLFSKSKVAKDTPPSPLPSPSIVQNPKGTLAYWEKEYARLKGEVESSSQVAQLRQDWFNNDIGYSFQTPQGFGAATLPPSYHALGKSNAFKELAHAEKMVVQLGGSIY